MEAKRKPLFASQRYFLIALLLSAVVFGLMAPGVFSRWETSHGRLQALQEKLAYYKALLKEREVLQGENVRVREILGPKEKPEEAMTGFIRVVERLASERGLVLNQIRPEERKSTADKNTLRIVLEAEAPLMNLARFFYGLFELPGLVKVEGMELRRSPRDPSKVLTALTLTKTLL